MLAIGAGDATVRQRCCPHKVGARVVVPRIFRNGRCLVDNRDHQALDHTVGRPHGAASAHVSLQQMRVHIGDAASRLICRQGFGQLGIQDAKRRQQHRRGRLALEHRAILRDHRIGRGLGTGSRDGKHATDRQGPIGRTVAAVKVPHVTRITCAGSNGLRGIDNAAAAESKNKVNALVARQRNALVDRAQQWIGLHALKLNMVEQRTVERIEHARQQPRALDRATAKQHKHLGAAVMRDKPARLALGTMTEHKVCGQAVREILHHNHALKRS